MKRILTFSVGLLCTSLVVAGDWDSVYTGPAARVVDRVRVEPNPTPAPTVIAQGPLMAQPTPIFNSNPMAKILDMPILKPRASVITTASASVYSGTTVPMVPVLTPAPTVIPTPTLPAYLAPRNYSSAVDLSHPLPNILTMPLPTTSTVSCLPTNTVQACETECVPCGTPLFGSHRNARGVVGMGSLPSMERLKQWIYYQPGPSVLPVFTPTPYQAPVRAYFPCNTSQCANQGAVNCYAPHDRNAVVNNAGVTPVAACTSTACRAPIVKGFGLFAKPSSTCATTGSIGVNCAPVAVPLPASCVGTASPTTCTPRACGSVLDRMLAIFTCESCQKPNAWACPSTTCNLPNQSGCTAVCATSPTATVPVIMGFTQPASGYRFANPVAVPGYAQSMPPVAKAPTVQSVAPAANTMTAANRPFTNP